MKAARLTTRLAVSLWLLGATQTAAPLPDLERALLSRLNEARAELGRSALAAHPALRRAAEERAESLSRRRSLSSTSAEVTALNVRLWRLGYRPHFWREAVVAGELLPAGLRRAEPEPALLREHLEHAAVVCRRWRGAHSLCLILVGERKLTRELRAAAPLRDLEPVRQAVLVEVNRLREGRGRGPLEDHPDLHRAAQLHAEAMLELGFYDHLAPDGSRPRQRAQAAGYRARLIAENIAKVVTTPEDAVNRWMSSSGHRRNLLEKKAIHHGLGVAVGVERGDVVALWCQLIAAP